jgi:deoxyribonuclease-4
MKGTYLGAHMSIAGGIHRAVDRAVEVKSDVLQVFVKNASRWQAPPRSESETKKFRSAVRKAGLLSVVAHNSYLTNLASPDPVLRKKSTHALIDELNRSEELGIDYLVIHPGAHLGSGVDEGIRQIVRSLDQVHKKLPDVNVRIALETTAGQGSSIGYRFEHLRDILEQTRESERLFVCLDTCHVFAAGYDLRTKRDFINLKVEFDRVIGREKLKVVHLNDSKRELGSRVDRHQHIGKGEIGLEGFRCLMQDPWFEKIPKILETPKGSDSKNDVMNLSTLRELRS